MPPFPVRFPLPPSTTRAAAAAVGAVIAAVALRRYLSTSRRRPSASVAMSALRSSTSASASAATMLVAYGKSPQDQELLASAAGSLALGEGDSAWGFAVALAYEGAGFDAAAYMGALRARQFGRWMIWSPRIGSTQDLIMQ